jgi:hypothetical protein
LLALALTAVLAGGLVLVITRDGSSESSSPRAGETGFVLSVGLVDDVDGDGVPEVTRSVGGLTANVFASGPARVELRSGRTGALMWSDGIAESACERRAVGSTCGDLAFAQRVRYGSGFRVMVMHGLARVRAGGGRRLVIRSYTSAGRRDWSYDVAMSSARCGPTQTPVLQGFGDLTGDGIDDALLTRGDCSGSGSQLLELDGKTGNVSRRQHLDVKDVTLVPSLDRSGSVSVLGSNPSRQGVSESYGAWSGADGRLLWSMQLPAQVTSSTLNVAVQQPRFIPGATFPFIPPAATVSLSAADLTGDGVPDLFLTGEQGPVRIDSPAFAAVVDGATGRLLARRDHPGLRAEPLGIARAARSAGTYAAIADTCTCGSFTVEVVDRQGRTRWLDRGRNTDPRTVDVINDVDGDGTADIAITKRTPGLSQHAQGTILSGKTGRTIRQGALPAPFNRAGLTPLNLSLDGHGQDFGQLKRQLARVTLDGIDGRSGKRLWTWSRTYPNLDHDPELAEPTDARCAVVAVLTQADPNAIHPDTITMLDGRTGREAWTLSTRALTQGIAKLSC